MRANTYSGSDVRPDIYVLRREAVAAAVAGLWWVVAFAVAFLVINMTVDNASRMSVVGVWVTAAVGSTAAALLAVIKGFGIEDRKVRLVIDSTGIYLNRRRVERLEWAQIAEVVLVHTWQLVEGAEVHDKYMVIRLTRLSSAAPKAGLTRRLCNVWDHNAIHAAIARHAPTVPVRIDERV
jgi:hypothetical protein